MAYQLLKIGSDAEFFLRDARQQPMPVCGLVGGTKQEPLPVLEGNGYAVQEDNVTLEFNIPPAGTAEEFANSLTKMLSYLTEQMAQKGLSCHYRSEEIFTVGRLKAHPGAYMVGCEPDFCVWTRTVNPSPEYPTHADREAMKTNNSDAYTEPRCAGYHVHVSYLVDGRDSTLEEKENFVKAQDLFLGVPSVLVERPFLSNARHSRRQFYGRAGAFRPKPYGHEYRVLGSSLLSPSPARNQWIFNATQAAISWLNMTPPDILEATLQTHRGDIMRAINDYQLEYVQNLMAQFPIFAPPML